jgi:hypothetical protein
MTLCIRCFAKLHPSEWRERLCKECKEQQQLHQYTKEAPEERAEVQK